MKYQVVIAGFGGQGVVFLVKALSICAENRGLKFLGTENHGMSQRGGSVSCDIKIGDFYTPVIEKNQADLLIGLEENEALRNIELLKPSGILEINSKLEDLDKIDREVVQIDAFNRAANGEFPIQALNVFMLGAALARVKNFPFTKDEVKEAIRAINPKVAEQNFAVLESAIRDLNE